LLLLLLLQNVLAAWMLTDLLHCTDTARAVCTQPALLLWPPCPRQSGLAASPADFAADAAAACPARCTHQYQRNILVMMAAEHLWQVKLCQTSEQSAELRNLGLARWEAAWCRAPSWHATTASGGSKRTTCRSRCSAFLHAPIRFSTALNL